MESAGPLAHLVHHRVSDCWNDSGSNDDLAEGARRSRRIIAVVCLPQFLGVGYRIVRCYIEATTSPQIKQGGGT